MSVAALAGFAVATAPAAVAAGEGTTKGLASLPLYPLTGTPFDLLSNNLVVPVDGTEVSTFPVTAPLRGGLALGRVVGVGALVE